MQYDQYTRSSKYDTMNRIDNYFRHFLLVLTAFLMLSCSRDQASEHREVTVDTADPADTVSVRQTGKTADDRVAELRNWMNEKAERADTSIRRDWPQVKEEFRQRSWKYGKSSCFGIIAT
jgi:hypothetical protein